MTAVIYPVEESRLKKLLSGTKMVGNRMAEDGKDVWKRSRLRIWYGSRGFSSGLTMEDKIAFPYGKK